MKKILLTMLLGINISAQGSEHAITLGGSWLDHDGFNSLGLDRPENTLLERDQSDLGWQLGYRWSNDRFRLGVTYQDLGRQNFSGVSPDANIFGFEGVVAAQVITPFKLNSELTAVVLDVAYLHALNDNWLLELGPSVSFSHQDIRITTGNNGVIRNTSRSDNNLGYVLGLQHNVNDHWQWNLQLRETRYDDLKVRLAGINLAYVF